MAAFLPAAWPGQSRCRLNLIAPSLVLHEAARIDMESLMEITPEALELGAWSKHWRPRDFGTQALHRKEHRTQQAFKNLNLAWIRKEGSTRQGWGRLGLPDSLVILQDSLLVEFSVNPRVMLEAALLLKNPCQYANAVALKCRLIWHPDFGGRPLRFI